LPTTRGLATTLRDTDHAMRLLSIIKES